MLLLQLLQDAHQPELQLLLRLLLPKASQKEHCPLLLSLPFKLLLLQR
jgi:hypothetical protein